MSPLYCDVETSIKQKHSGVHEQDGHRDIKDISDPVGRGHTAADERSNKISEENG